jgi:hypothetical protein
MAFFPVRSTSGSVLVPRPGHFRLGALGGSTPVDFFLPAQHSALTRRPDPATPGLESLRGRTPIFLTCLQHTGAIWFLAPRPIHIWLGALGCQTMVFNHPTFHCFPPLQPLALSTLRPRRSGTSLKRTMQHAHTSFSHRTTHRNFRNLIEKQTPEHSRKSEPKRDGKYCKNENQTQKEAWLGAPRTRRTP